MSNARTLRSVVALVAVAVLSLFLSGTAHAQDGEGEAFSGTLRFEGEPVEGVRISVVDSAGEVVGEAVSGADGKWRVELPGPGTYQATIDTNTLPEGISLRDPERQTLEVTVTAGRSRPLIFALGEPAARGPTVGEKLAQAVLNGVKFGLIIAMCAIGLSLIFGLTGLINFAHGELVTLGAILAWYFNADTFGAPLILAGVLAVVVAGAAGGGVEFSLLRPLRARRLGMFQFMVVTIGLSLLARHVMLLFFGPDRERFVDYALQTEWTFGPFAVTPRDFTIMALSAVILIGVAVFLQRARTGKAIRAVADNPELAESSGIDVDRVI
ncbi:MAG: branched-chain amino acid ABC transporter permease, partial [Dehalococcoidia bacterium]|nr:branched-chain amino acid ABC transporter permease [Dehalococcoidia bacterium]